MFKLIVTFLKDNPHASRIKPGHLWKVSISSEQHTGLEQMLDQVISSGGDTDTNASIAGQIAGALLGPEKIPGHLKNRLADLPEYSQIIDTIRTAKTKLESQPGL